MIADRMGKLARERADRFWRRIMPELRLFGHYLPGFFLVGLVALFLYDRLIEQLQPAPWLPAMCALPVTASVAWVRVRTWLQPADPVFVMPAESAMGGYVRQVILAAWPGQLLAAAGTALAVWPLFRVQGVMTFGAYGAVIFALLVLKTANMLLWWREQQMAHGRIRAVFALLRWAGTFLSVLAGLLLGAAVLLICAAFLVSVLLTGGRRVVRFALNWERMIALERRALAAWRRFLGQFAATETDGGAARPNPFARLAGFIRHAPENAGHYLYLLVWLRSPLFGITLRLTAIGTAIAAAVGDAWLKAGIGVLFAAALHVQLKELGRDEGAVEREHLLPLPEAGRKKAARDVRAIVWFVGTLLLAVPAVLSLVI
jgi:ABC-2 type transport system permease protein